MPHRHFTEIAAVGMTVASIISVLWTGWDRAPRVDRTVPEAIGQALAREAIRLIGRGGKIVIITRDTVSFPQPAMEIVLERIQRELRRETIPPALIQLVQVDPLRPVEVPSGDFFESIRRAPEGQVIISLLGPPLLSDEQRTKLGRVKPKVVAFCSGNIAGMVDLRRLFEAGLLHAAIVGRPLPTGAPVTGAKFRETFDQLYLTVPGTDASKKTSVSGAAL